MRQDRRDEPIIRSLLDTDFYKFTMGQLVFERHADVPVRYGLINRTRGVRLADVISEEGLRAELDHVRSLRFGKTELHYLRGTNEYGERMFAEPYLEFLARFELPPYELEKVDGDYRVEFTGPWSTAIYWETIALAIVNELYYRALMRSRSRFERDVVFAQGRLNLENKIRLLKASPELQFTFCDFGTRRRFSREWQEYVVAVLAEEIPDRFLGTSNTLLAMQQSLLPMGTSAHEMFMVMSCIMRDTDEDLRASHNRVLREWWERYGFGLSVALTDTFGTDFFFRDMTSEQAASWKGLRQDSGEPYEFGQRAIEFYSRLGIDPKTKLLVFSDGLDVKAILNLAYLFGERIRTTFGWGTNLTNDLGFNSLSLVVKVIGANGYGTVKLSDNLAKAMGRMEDIERFKRVFGYTNTARIECTY